MDRYFCRPWSITWALFAQVSCPILIRMIESPQRNGEVPMNKLYFGDNLYVMRDHIPSESIDLVYLDPPFNSNKNYNILFNSPKGQKSEAQITAFEDTWHWGDQAEREYTEILHQPNTDVAEMIFSFRKFLKNSDMMAYLTMMTIRLLELHHVFAPLIILYEKQRSPHWMTSRPCCRSFTGGYKYSTLIMSKMQEVNCLRLCASGDPINPVWVITAICRFCNCERNWFRVWRDSVL